MIDRELVKSSNGKRSLCRTFSVEGFRLLQKETNMTIGYEAIDVIEGYDENKKPFSRFTYEETNEMESDAV